MKKIYLIVVIAVVANAYSQKSIDALFEKYANKDGFTTLTINGNLLKMAGCLGEDENSMPADVTEIRILAQEDGNMKVENFYDVVIKDIDLSLYEEFMRVKETNQDVRMLVRTEGNMFKEFLLISGGEDNALIQIKGSMSMDEAKKFSGEVKKNHGEGIVSNSN
jgi:hypothetical protein